MYIEELLKDAEAHYENALDDIYYGYGYDFWRTHYDCDKDLSEEDAKLVWEIAMWVMTDEYCEGISDKFPSLHTAYMWKENGCPKLDPDQAVEIYSKAEDIASHFDPEAISFDDDDTESILIKDKYSGMEFWFHSWINEKCHDIDCEWNQYIFYLTDSDDVLRKLLQENNWVFDLVSSEALAYQQKMGVVHQWDNGYWYKTPENNK